jgi:hypothetical protein
MTPRPSLEPDVENLRRGIDWRVMVWTGHASPAPEAGVAPGTWSKLLRGDRIRTDALTRVARFLRWPLDFRTQLLAGVDAQEIETVVYSPASKDEESILHWLEATGPAERRRAPERAPDATVTEAQLQAAHARLDSRRRRQLVEYATFLVAQQVHDV